jgi:hypothetical protein
LQPLAAVNHPLSGWLQIGISAADKVFPALSQLAKMSPRIPGVQVAALIE